MTRVLVAAAATFLALVLVTYYGAVDVPFHYFLVSLAVLAVATRLWWSRRTHPKLDTARGTFGLRSKSSAVASKWGARADRKQGVATPFDILRRSSGFLMLKRGAVVRPSLLGNAGRWQRWTVGARNVGVRLARVGFLSVWASLEDVTIVFGGPRTGKTAWLGSRIIDFCGMLIVTSTRPDIYDATARWRRMGGRNVYIFNPSGLGGDDYATSISFDPLTGCLDPSNAADRAADMIGAAGSGGGGGGDRAHWDGQARRVLAALMHAAALGGLGMRDVLRWVANPDANKAEILRLLRTSPAKSMLPAVEQFVGTNINTRSSITSGIMPALEWLNSATAAAAGSRDLWPFNVQHLLDERATVYLIGSEEAHTAPLVAALTGYIAREGKAIAATMPGNRLDPPLGLYLDEAANVSPVPLHKWTSHFGGSGLTILLAFQSRAQLLERWGKAAAAIILNNAGAIMLFGGTKDTDDLDFWSTLSGTRHARTPEYDENGIVKGYNSQRVPVFSAPQLSQLPPWRVVIFRKAMLPCVGKVRPYWKRWDVKYADRLPWWLAVIAACIRFAVWMWDLLGDYTWRSKPAPAPQPDPAQQSQPQPQPAGRP